MRDTTAGNKLLQLEALRGFAALYVVLHHTIHVNYFVAGLDIGRLLRFGQEAVILFFLISGFVINHSFRTGNDFTFRTYFIKRFTRIYIPLFVVFAVGFLTESFNAGQWVVVGLKPLVLNLLMLQDAGGMKPGVIVEPLLNNGPLWSLSYEWWFYMLYYPIIRLFSNHQSQNVLVFSVAVVASGLYVLYPGFATRLFAYMGIWWAGVFLSNLYLDEKPFLFRNCLPVIAVLSAISGILSIKVIDAVLDGQLVLLGLHPLLELRHFGFALAAVIIAVLWHRWRWRGFDTLFAPFLVLAPISYVLYISHYHVMVSATYLDFIENPLIEYLMYFAILLLFSWLVERVLYPLVRQWVYKRSRHGRSDLVFANKTTQF
ncbi:MAG: acyltransferase [Granulosicoccus sp.]